MVIDVITATRGDTSAVNVPVCSLSEVATLEMVTNGRWLPARGDLHISALTALGDQCTPGPVAQEGELRQICPIMIKEYTRDLH